MRGRYSKRGPESGLLNLDDHLRASLTLGLALDALAQWPVTESRSKQSEKIQEGLL